MRGGMGLFHVYVEAPDRAPETIARLAETIGKKYGVPVADLEKRLAAGRFRVKANVDRETADVYAKALGEHGAVVRIEDAVATPAAGTPVERGGSTTPPANTARTGSPSLPPRNASSSLPPRNAGASLPAPNVARTGTSSLPPTTKPAPVVASGLAAAYTATPQTDLGALSTDSISLASLDGTDPVGDEAFAPPVDLSPAIAAAPAAPAASPGKKAKPKDEPVDLFAPPDAAEDAAFQVELAADEIEHRAKKMSTPPVGVPVPIPATPSAATPQLSQRKKPITPVAGVPVTVSPDAQEAPRWRFAAGVLLAIILGFVPAHLIASAREKSAFSRIDQEVIAQQNAADSSELYEALDQFRTAKQAQKQSEKRNIAMLSMLIWGVAAGGLAYVWFRRVPWDRVGRS